VIFSVHWEGKHVWIAVGDYLGKEIRAQAESEGAASNAGEKQHQRW
jgi:hypothetical protein